MKDAFLLTTDIKSDSCRLIKAPAEPLLSGCFAFLINFRESKLKGVAIGGAVNVFGY